MHHVSSKHARTLRAALIGLFAVVTGIAGAEDWSELSKKALSCELTADGHVLYSRGGALYEYPVKLYIAGTGSKLTVGGTTNLVEKLKVTEQETGRTMVTMLFKNPPALGTGTSALLVGTLMKDAKSVRYYGDIYQWNEGAPFDCRSEDWSSPSKSCWKHKGGFSFKTAR